MTVDIQDLIDEIVLEVGGDSDDTDFAAIILQFFKSALRHIPAYIRDRLFINETTITLSAGSYSHAVPDGFIKEREIWYQTSENKRIPIVEAINQEYFNRVFTPNATGKPLYYKIYGKTIKFNITADSNITIGFDYFSEISDVIASTDFFGTEQMAEAIKHWCKSLYYRNYEQDAGSADAEERLAKELMREFEGDYEVQEQGGHVIEE